jgi:hypothetical protein
VSEPTTTLIPDATPTAPGVPGSVPPLRDGDRLTRDEFERRYDAMPHLKKAELIEGVVYMPSPVRVNQHGHPHRMIAGWMLVYEAATPGVLGADDTTVRLDLNNDPQPDSVLFILPLHGGRARISEDDYLEGGPEMAAEIAASNVNVALGDKLQAYRRNGVQEYIVWRVVDRAIDWFVLRSGQYQRLAADAQGVFRSIVFPGLWLDSVALLRGDKAGVLATLQLGLATPEHADFVKRLNPNA